MGGRSTGMLKRKAFFSLFACLTVSGIAGCEASKKQSKPETSNSSTDSSSSEKVLTQEEVIADAKAKVEAAYEGSFGSPPATGPSATPDKTVWVISCSDLIESCKVPGRYAEEAAKEMGWDVTYAEGQLQATVTSDKIRSAVAAKADAIILVGTDCPSIQASLQEAKGAGTAIVGIYSFDCDDPTFEGAALFDASARAAVGGETTQEQQTTWGRIKADWVIADSNGTAKVIQLNSNDRLVIRYTGLGFEEELRRCTGCSIVGRVDATDSEILQIAPALAKGDAVIAEHPEAEYTHSPIDSILPFLVLPSIQKANREGSIKVIGGEGLDANMDYIRSGKQAMALAYPHEWMAWSAVDIVNRIFADADITVDQGISWQLVDKDHNLPESGPYVPPVDFKKYYREVWGTSGS